MSSSNQVSELDKFYLNLIRSRVNEFLDRAAKLYGGSTGKLLDIAPQDHEGAKPFFGCHVNIETFDINPSSGCTYIGDICKKNECIPDASFKYIVCTEVLEHTLQPFLAVQEMFRILSPGGYCFITTPFNFRIHGPLPDCWRFTEHGLRELFKAFEIIELEALEDPDRFLMPIQYSLVARKPE